MSPLLKFREAVRVESEFAGEYVCGFADGGFVFVRQPDREVHHSPVDSLLNTAREWAAARAMSDHAGATVAYWVLELARQAQGGAARHPLPAHATRVQLAHADITARHWVRRYDGGGQDRSVEQGMGALLLCLRALLEEPGAARAGSDIVDVVVYGVGARGRVVVAATPPCVSDADVRRLSELAASMRDPRGADSVSDAPAAAHPSHRLIGMRAGGEKGSGHYCTQCSRSTAAMLARPCVAAPRAASEPGDAARIRRGIG